MPDVDVTFLADFALHVATRRQSCSGMCMQRAFFPLAGEEEASKQGEQARAQQSSFEEEEEWFA